ncbi:uncharacterized protein LOC115445749 isoform X3 [Manduca sexta]|uniref:C2H2-type domain-containing protein n=1 Tax=Manduca sexta TaxID=7130 RepID=A0A921YJU4_MANSE|nr:uncharacterized protein LOC115445749 isoform X3 [Manduca sexta]KAG6440372.1 hypothetical protein O3G_MSEX001250 [Manduca sexta]
MMFSDEDIKGIPENSFMRPGDEIISIREVCLSDKFDRKDLGFHIEPLLSTSARNDLDVSRSLFRDGFFPEGLEQQQARFAWTEEDGNIASLVSEPGFGTTGQTTFGKDLDAELKSEMKEADTSTSAYHPPNRNGITFETKPYVDSQLVSSTSTGNALDRPKSNGACKVDKTDPRSRVHYVKYIKRHGRSVKLWECGICSREFQHQYTLMRHLPTHTDERNFHCAACGKSFRQLSTLSQHRAIHSVERPYACEVCNKTFNRVSTLISHRKTHSNEKPYRCHICPKGFHQKGNLRNHLFTHTNERPYRCNICLKGFNQQSNLVCHKNKAHPDESSATVRARYPRVSRPADPQPDSARPPSDHCEVTSSVGPYLPSVDSSDWAIKSNWDVSKTYEQGDIWNESWGSMGNGVIVDPIKTYHMGVALATKQTPFALLKPDNGAPVLVKVINTNLPGGKQMLVPATAEDLRVGGKIVMKDGDDDSQISKLEPGVKLDQAVQIRVPVVATVVPRIKPGGRLHLAVEEPHHAYHTTLTADVGAVLADSCVVKEEGRDCPDVLSHADLRVMNTNSNFEDGALKTRPQITAVDDVDRPPASDDSDIFIGKFEESIPLSDSD